MTLWAVLSGLASALCWGAGDFVGGLASRRAAAVRVVLASQFVGTLALIGLGLALGQPWPPPVALWTGAVAGLAGGIGLLLLYLSLARGVMSIAAPLTAVAAGGIPLLVGLLIEGWPSPTQLAGFLLALAAIWIISRTEGGGRLRVGDVALPLLAGVGFGVFLALIGQIDEEIGFAWPLVAGRVASMALMCGAIVLSRAGRGPKNDGAGRFPWLLAALAGLGDTGGNAFFVLSAQLGRLDVAAVLSALYPAATVALARVALSERMTPRQNMAVGLALAAVVLIAL